MLCNNTERQTSLIAVVPAAGIGKRMQSHLPKQYLKIGEQTVLAHTVLRLLTHPMILQVIIVVAKDDPYFLQTGLQHHAQISTVYGGAERVDSVLAGLQAINSADYPWVLVHDAARPCVRLTDISALIEQCFAKQTGGLLACAVRDTMKRSNCMMVTKTVAREQLWHALTPQLFNTKTLLHAISLAKQHNLPITDESSAIEFTGEQPLLVAGANDNIKITEPNDLVMAEFILKQQEQSCV